jgi:hypothetical protein
LWVVAAARSRMIGIASCRSGMGRNPRRLLAADSVVQMAEEGAWIVKELEVPLSVEVVGEQEVRHRAAEVVVQMVSTMVAVVEAQGVRLWNGRRPSRRRWRWRRHTGWLSRGWRRNWRLLANRRRWFRLPAYTRGQRSHRLERWTCARNWRWCWRSGPWWRWRGAWRFRRCSSWWCRHYRASCCLWV